MRRFFATQSGLRIADAFVVLLALMPLGLIAATMPASYYGPLVLIYGSTLLVGCAISLLIAHAMRLASSRRSIDRAKDEFLSFASHQLRTPLTTMRWRVEMMLDGHAGPLSRTQRSFLNEVESSTKRMANLVNQFLNVSRINLGTFAVNPESCDIHELIHSVIKELRPLVKRKKIALHTAFGARYPDLICDPRITRILIFNLIANAIHYTSRGSVTVDTKRNKNAFEVTITDTGIGIPADQQEYIFTKLFRADNIDEMNPHGSGLGLYIVKTLLGHMGGSIAFSSEEGAGTVFILSLPTDVKAVPARRAGTKHLTPSFIG